MLTQLNLSCIPLLCEWIYICILWFDLADNLWIIDNSIGDEGGKALAEALKVNSTLTQLNLSCMSSFCGWIYVCILWFDLADNLWIIDNSIGDEGGKALAEALKVNSTLTQLNLECMSSFCGWIYVCILWFDLADNLWIIDNSIGDEGGKALGEALKVNATLTQLNLSCMSSFCGWIYVCILWFDLADNLWIIDCWIGSEGGKALG